jgi:hypothetical protein
MIELKDIQGNILLSVPITQSCQKVEELMVADYIQLSWDSNLSDEIPLGAYIEYNGERYSLLEPYNPTQKNESDYTYTPKFESRVRAWGKKPFFFYSGESKEPDWTLTSNPSDFMRCVCDAILKETGESWTYSIDASLAASASLSFSSSDILSGLNQIADAFETEWLADKETNTIYLGLLSHGEEVTLEVGNNIGVPSIQNSKEGYYTRFYAFGSTRNITQDYTGSNTNNLVNKRLTLDPNKYPQGYKDIRGGLSEGEIFSKVLIFDNVYPSSKLSISGVRNRLMYRLDDSGNKIQLGTDESGNPIYDQYTIWYFRLEGFTFDWNNVIEGLTPSISFQSGALNGREFEIIYHDKSKKITTSDGLTFEVKEGDYEICFVEENNLIIPSMTGLIPNDGDKVIVFNIKMPSEYTQSAYIELEEELDKAIDRMTSDLNNYSFKSNPVVFNESNPNLSIGRKVRYVNGSYSYSTRVIKLNTQLDFPIEQTITIGNEKVKGNTQQLREEVASANKDLNLMSVFNNMTQSLQQSYNRTQQMMLDGFAAIKNIWQIRETENGEKYIFSAYDVATQKGITMYHDGKMLNLPSLASGLPFDGRTIWYNPNTNQIEVIGGTGGGSGEGVSNFWDLSGIPSWITNSKPKYSYSEIEGTPDLSGYALKSELPSLTGYATQTWVKNQGYLTQHQDLSGYQTKITSSNKLAYSLISGTPTSLKNPNALSFGSKSYDGSAKITLTADDLGALTSHQTIYTLTFASGTFASGTFTANSAKKTINIPTTTSHISEGSNLYFTNARAVSALTETLKAYVTLGGTQTITGEKNFTGSLKVNGSPIYYDIEKKYWKLEGDLLVTGGVTMYGSDSSFTPSTIMDAIAVDGTTISKSGGVLKVIGGTGGGVADSVAWDNITDKPTWIGSSKPTYSYSEIKGAISTTELQNYLTSNSYLNVTEGDNRYLKLNGGTLTGKTSISARLSLTNGAYLEFVDKNESIRLFGVYPNKNDLSYYDGAWNKVWHEGNFNPSNYLPLSGGTISGTYGALTIHRTNENSSLIKYSNTSGVLGYLGFNSSNEPIVYKGTDTNTQYKIWHTGNGGSDSGLDADLLDGKHADAFALSNKDIKLDSFVNQIGYGYKSQGWYFSGAAMMFGANSNYYMLLQGTVIEGNIYLRANYMNNGSYVGWKSIAFTDSNVASATKLETARTIWGQSFDGTGNVSGDVTLDNKSYIKCCDTSGNSYNTFGLNASNSLLIGYGTRGAGYETYIYGRQLRLYSGTSGEANFILDSSGKVGIGTTSPAYKLDVNGSASINGNAYIGTSSSSILTFMRGSYNYIKTPESGSLVFNMNGSPANLATSSLYLGGSSVILGYNGAKVGIGVSPTCALHVSGDILATGAMTFYSMRKLKNVVDERGLSLSELSTIKPTRYTWKDGRDDRLHFGGIADDIQQVLPEVVYSTSDGILTMDYGNAAFAVASSLIQPVVDHEKRIAMLEAENKQLRQEVERLKSA